MGLNTISEIITIVIATSIFFVWVVRYDNIIQEFKEYELPNWLRDLTGILKLSFAAMILNSNPQIVALGALGIFILMLAAQGTHLKSQTKLSRRLPSFALLVLSLVLFLKNI